MGTTSNSVSVFEDGYFGQDCISPWKYPSFGKSAKTSVNVPFQNVITTKNVETGQAFILTYVEKIILADLLLNVVVINPFNFMVSWI